MEYDDQKTDVNNIGIFGVGLHTYWSQFNGLEKRLEGYLNGIAEKLQDLGIGVVNGGLVDTPDKARDVAGFFREKHVEMLFLYVSTYALSHTVLPVAQQTKVPVVILNLQPLPSIDYKRINGISDRGVMTGEWLANCQACAVPEIARVFNDAGIKYDIITGWLEDPDSWKEITEWCNAVNVFVNIRNSRIGILGHYYCGMLDVYTDVTRLMSVFGTHFELLEMDRLKALRDRVNKKEIELKLDQFKNEFSISDECGDDELYRAAHTSCALDALVDEENLDAMAYYYEGQPGNDHENIITSVIAGNTILTSHHIPVAGECEVKTALAMKIVDSFNAGGSFSEIVGVDFTDDVMILGHDGPAHSAIAQGKVELVPLPVYHGKPGKGLSIQMTVRYGPATLLAVVQGPKDTFFLCAEGESVSGPVLEIGNTESRYRFPLHVKDFINQWSKAGPSHHWAIGTGHIAGSLEKLAQLFGIRFVKIC
ncbi:MAG: L-fucose/L-arabinose isomerase family protein [Treponema sp.]|jgi:L-arabinose isomerase|nr:L-fucose/L-arabinose isomerase family protein [Treponema sp.]